MESFGIIGMSFGTTAFVFSLVALSKIVNLEKQLRDGGVLGKTDKSQ